MLALAAGCSNRGSTPTEARIIKVLPSLLDAEGRASIHPSLYERDAYQALLRKESSKVAGLRFDILWTARPASPGTAASPVVLKLELRGSSHGKDARAGNTVVVERPIPRSQMGRAWSQVVLGPDEFRRVGEVSAWRATLLRNDHVIATTQSFLW
jgi:hypothetical protein